MARIENNVDNAGHAEKAAGILAQFESADSLRAAAAQIRQAGFRHWDAHSPFPVHGLDRAMGIRPTILPWLVLGAGLTGGAAGLLLQWWANTVEYPLNISGKPLFSLPANIPITFELIVLFSALTAFVGSLALSLLPQYWHAAFASRAFTRVTTDGFFISLDAHDPKYEESSLRQLLESLGATRIETCHAPATGRKLPTPLYWAIASLAVLALLPPVVVAWMRVTPSSQPRIHVFKDMDFQPKFKAQAANWLFQDGRSDRPKVPGSVTHGQVDDEHWQLGKVGGQWAHTFPTAVALNRQTMHRGGERFNIYCAACHGLAGEGDGMTARRAQSRAETTWVPPVQLYAATVRSQAVGQIHHTITHGIRKMPGYGSQIPVEDRWAIVLYLQALQRSQQASWEDIPQELRDKVR